MEGKAASIDTFVKSHDKLSHITHGGSWFWSSRRILHGLFEIRSTSGWKMQRCNGVALEGNNELESKIFRPRATWWPAAGPQPTETWVKIENTAARRWSVNKWGGNRYYVVQWKVKSEKYYVVQWKVHNEEESTACKRGWRWTWPEVGGTARPSQCFSMASWAEFSGIWMECLNFKIGHGLFKRITEVNNQHLA